MTEAELKLKHAAEFRRCLVDLDVAGVMALWRHVAPHLGQPSSEREALYTMHLARTKAENVSPRLRAYSQRWLNERGFGSFLPENRRGH